MLDVVEIFAIRNLLIPAWLLKVLIEPLFLMVSVQIRTVLCIKYTIPMKFII